MFKKLISSLPFSPALVGQLSFYAKRLKREESTRKVGLIFTALALVIQSFAVFQPPEAANASSSNDLIRGGFSTREEFLRNYDANTGNLKDLFKAVGISRSDIQNSKNDTWNSRSDGGYSWGHLSRFSRAQGERPYTVPTASGGTTTFYYRPLHLSDSLPYTIRNGSTYQALVGKTAKGMRFSLLKLCGNLVLKVTPPPVPCPTGTTGTFPNCKTQRCPENTTGTYPNCTVKAASCDMLRIDKIADNYQLTGAANVSGGASVSSYTYTVKRDGSVIYTKVVDSVELSNTHTYKQTQKGSYTVELTVNTSLGAKKSPDCVKTFNITPPEVCPLNPKLPKSSPECQPCPGDTTLWVKDEKCKAELLQTKTARNITQGSVNATTVIAKADDKIIYSLNVENTGNTATDTIIVEKIDDVAEYANVIDAGGATQSTDPETKIAILTWPKVSLKAGEKITRMFTVQLMSTIPAMGKGESNPTSYDCKMMNTFGNNVTINVNCPIQKQVVEAVSSQLPHTGPTENIIAAGSVLAVVAFFYARARQLKTEVRLIRRDFNTGTI